MIKIIFGLIMLILLLVVYSPGFSMPEEVMGKVGLIFLMALGIGLIVWGVADKVSELANKKRSDKKKEGD